VTWDSGIVTGDSGKAPEIGHVQTEWVVKMGRNMQYQPNFQAQGERQFLKTWECH